MNTERSQKSSCSSSSDVIKVNKYTRRETGGPALHTNYAISLCERRHPALVVLLLPLKCPIRCVMFDVEPQVPHGPVYLWHR